MNPAKRVQDVRSVFRRRWSPSLLPPDEDATPEGVLHELRSNVQCAPLKSGFVVCIANLMSEELPSWRRLALRRISRNSWLRSISAVRLLPKLAGGQAAAATATIAA